MLALTIYLLGQIEEASLQYFDEAKHFEGGNSPMDGSLIPEKWGKPKTAYEGNFNNSIFALLGGYNTENQYGENNFSIRTLDPTTKIYTVGWYNLKSGRSTDSNAEVNLEIQFNMNNDSFKIVHGQFGNRFPDALTNVTAHKQNYFTGISQDLSCLTTTEDISTCEGKDYVQFLYYDPYFSQNFYAPNPIQTFQDPNGDNESNRIDSMYNSYFSSPTTSRNGSFYCFVGEGGGVNLTSSCSSSYSSNVARPDVNGRLYEFSPLDNGTLKATPKNVLIPSNIKQSYRSGFESEFIWMNLDKDPTTLTYTPADNATGFESGANSRDGVSGGSLTSGSSISNTTANDEIVIAGEVYTADKLQTFLENTKKVVAYAPIQSYIQIDMS